MAASKTDNQTPEQAAVEPETATRLDQTIPGGKYLVNGRWVDANGKPIADEKQG